ATPSTRTAVALNGGNLSTGGFSEGDTSATPNTLGSLTLSGNSSLTLGSTPGAETLAFSDLGTNLSSFNGSLTIYNWEGTPGSLSSTDHIFFDNLTGADTSTLYNQILFNINGAYYGGRFGAVTNGFELYADVTPVPEPSTVVGALTLVSFVGYRERRR